MLYSCRKSTGPEIIEESEVIEEPNVNGYVSKIMPMTIGNYWIYKETYTSSDTTYSHDIKSEVTAIKDIGNYWWYEMTITNNDYQATKYYMAENDSIYELQYNWLAPIRDRKSTRLNSSHIPLSRMPSSS